MNRPNAKTATIQIPGKIQDMRLQTQRLAIDRRARPNVGDRRQRRGANAIHLNGEYPGQRRHRAPQRDVRSGKSQRAAQLPPLSHPPPNRERPAQQPRRQREIAGSQRRANVCAAYPQPALNNATRPIHRIAQTLTATV